MTTTTGATAPTTATPGTTALSIPKIDVAQLTDIYSRAAVRLQKCEAFTEKLLALELSDENDAKLQAVILNCGTAVKEIQSERMNYTKAFDQIKKEFTTIESGISNAAARLQKARDIHATNKALAKQKAEAEIQNKKNRELELVELRRECEMQLANYVGQLKQTLSTLFAKGFKTITAENYDEKVAAIKAYSNKLPKEYSGFKFTAWSKYGHEMQPITDEVRDRNANKYAEDWVNFIHELKTESLVHLQNKKAAGFAVSKDGVDGKEAAVILEVNTTVDTKQIEIQANVEKTMVQFENTAPISEEKPARESVKITVTDKLGFQAIAAFWFSTFLGSVDFDGLERKTLKSMIGDIEKHAKNTGEQIESDFVQYEVIYKAINTKK